MIIGSILLVLVLEGLRRGSGNVLAGILIVFIGYGFFGWLCRANCRADTSPPTVC